MEYREEIKWIVDQHKRVNQKYGDNLPYHVHLSDVWRYAKKFIHLIPEKYHRDIILAAWGHDLIEDTGLTYNDVLKVLGKNVADIVYALTNEKGRNRAERANDKYYENIKENDLALYVKLCDRLANMVYSKKEGQGMYKKYVQEIPNFKKKLYNGLYDEIWKEIDNIEFTERDNEYLPKIDKFDEDNIWVIKLPKPIPGDLYMELYRKGILPKKDLEKGKYYFGKCRNADAALWNGHVFIYMRTKFGHKFPEEINHLEDDDGFDLFVPLKEIIPTEEQRIRY